MKKTETVNTPASEWKRKGWFEDPQSILILLFFLGHFLLAFFDFLPNLKDINFWDEAIYVNWGRFLVEGKLPAFAQNPLMAFFYALLYLPFSRSPYWLVQICSLGRLLLFCLIWLGSYLSAREIKDQLNIAVFAGLLLVVPLVSEVLPNPSDAMFTALSAFACWQLLRYRNQQKTRNLVLSSLFIGLAALARNDGFVLFAIFLILSILFSLRVQNGWKNVLLGALPFIGIVGGYLLLSGLVTGDFSTGTIQRSYLAFEQGHEGVYEGAGIHSHTIDAMLDAREKFGTPQENNYSIVRAIQRNPGAYFARLKLILQRLPEQLLTVYNKKMGAILFLAAVLGALELLRRRKYLLLILLVSWPAYLLTYFLTFFREGYLRSPFFVVFLLAGIGLTSLFDRLEHRHYHWGASALLALLILTGLVFNKLAIYYGASLFLAGMWAVVWIRRRYADQPGIRSISLLVLLIVGVVLHGSYSSPKLQKLGANADERAAVYLMEHFPEGTKVGAGSPGVVWMAKQEFTAIIGSDVPAFETSADFHQWLLGEGIGAIYLDYSISNQAPYYWELIQQESGHGLQEVFNENAGSNRIYLVKQERE